MMIWFFAIALSSIGLERAVAQPLPRDSVSSERLVQDPPTDEVEETYQDSNGGTWTFRGKLGKPFGTYTRVDGDGNRTTGMWELDDDGNVHYQGDEGNEEFGVMTGTEDGYDYRGRDSEGNPESGSLTYD